MSKSYICDCCKAIIENPNKVKMKEFYIGAEIDSYGIFPVNSKSTTKIHLCDNCYKGLKNIKGGQQAEIERLNKDVDRLSQVVLYNDGVAEMKIAEAVKEFAEKVLLYIPNIEGNTTIKCVEEAIKQTLKETVGDE